MTNKINKSMWRLNLLALTVFVLVTMPLAAGAQSPLSASVDRTAITTDDTVTLSVVVNSKGDATARPELPALDGFAVVGTNMSSQISMVNGAVNASIGYDYRLQPTRAGDLTIGEVIATIDGVSYATTPITVQVTQGSGQSTGGSNAVQVLPPGQPGQSDAYVEATVDNANPYVGQQVLYTVRFYEAADSPLMSSFLGGQPSYAAPDFTGFWTQNDSEQKNYRATAGGRVYNVSELRTLLFPTAAGSVTIDPAQVIMPDSMFQRGGALQTAAVTLDVAALPTGAPVGFNGAVGHFVIQSNLDSAATDTDNPVTLRVTVIGQGNVSTAGDPVLPELEGWRVFPGKPAVETAVRDGLLYGQRTYEHLLAPTATGELAIPALEYVYFDPADGAYHTATTAALAVQVTQGKLAPAVVPPAALAGEPAADLPVAANAAGTALLALKPIAGPLQLAGAPLATQPWYWLLWVMPLAALTGGFVWQRRTLHLQNNAANIRSSRAGKAARKALSRARKEADTVAKMTQVQTLFIDYLSAKLHQPIAGVTRTALASLLTQRQMDAVVIDRTMACLDSVEYLRFSPAMAEPVAVTALLDTVEATIIALDTVLA